MSRRNGNTRQLRILMGIWMVIPGCADVGTRAPIPRIAAFKHVRVSPRIKNIFMKQRQGTPVYWAFAHSLETDDSLADFDIVGLSRAYVSPFSSGGMKRCPAGITLVDFGVMEYIPRYVEATPGVPTVVDLARSIHQSGFRFSRPQSGSSGPSDTTRMVIDPEPNCLYKGMDCFDAYVKEVLIPSARKDHLARCGDGLILNGFGVLDADSSLIRSRTFQRRFVRNATRLVSLIRRAFPKAILLINNGSQVLGKIHNDLDGIMLENFLLGLAGRDINKCVKYQLSSYLPTLRAIRSRRPYFLVLTIDRTHNTAKQYTSIQTSRRYGFIPYIGPYPLRSHGRDHWRVERTVQQFDRVPALRNRSWRACESMR